MPKTLQEFTKQNAKMSYATGRVTSTNKKLDTPKPKQWSRKVHSLHGYEANIPKPRFYNDRDKPMV